MIPLTLRRLRNPPIHARGKGIIKETSKRNDRTISMTPSPQPQAAPSVPLVIHAQYIRDMSFESPAAPDSIRPGQPAPVIDISVNMDARKGEDAKTEGPYEVVMSLTATARREQKTVFIAELQYAAMVSLPGLAEEHHHPMLLIEVPKMMFPFLRQILSFLTQQGGFPPLLIGPVDFYALYMEKFAQQQASQKQAIM